MIFNATDTHTTYISTNWTALKMCVCKFAIFLIRATIQQFNFPEKYVSFSHLNVKRMYYAKNLTKTINNPFKTKLDINQFQQREKRLWIKQL